MTAAGHAVSPDLACVGGDAAKWLAEASGHAGTQGRPVQATGSMWRRAEGHLGQGPSRRPDAAR